MSGTSITIDDRAFQKGLQDAAGRMKLRGRAELVKLGLRVQNEARILCPVDTGRLRSSIQMVEGQDGRGVYVTVGTNVEYAAFVEFGTRFMAAQPYMRPALAKAFGLWGQ